MAWHISGTYRPLADGRRPASPAPRPASAFLRPLQHLGPDIRTSTRPRRPLLWPIKQKSYGGKLLLGLTLNRIFFAGNVALDLDGLPNVRVFFSGGGRSRCFLRSPKSFLLGSRGGRGLGGRGTQKKNPLQAANASSEIRWARVQMGPDLRESGQGAERQPRIRSRRLATDIRETFLNSRGRAECGDERN